MSKAVLREQERILHKFYAETVFLSGNKKHINYSAMENTVKTMVKLAHKCSTGMYPSDPIPVGSYKEWLHLQRENISNDFDFIIPIHYKSKLELQSSVVPNNSSIHRAHQFPIYVFQNRAIYNHPDKRLPVFRQGTKVLVNIEEMMKTDMKLYFDKPELQLEEEDNTEFYQLEIFQESLSCCKLDPEQTLKDFHRYLGIVLNPGPGLQVSHTWNRTVTHLQRRAADLQHQADVFQNKTTTLKHQAIDLLGQAAVLKHQTTDLLCEAADLQRGTAVLQYRTTVLQRQAADVQHQITDLKHRAAILLSRRRKAKVAAVAALRAKSKVTAELAAVPAWAVSPLNRSGFSLQVVLNLQPKLGSEFSLWSKSLLILKENRNIKLETLDLSSPAIRLVFKERNETLPVKLVAAVRGAIEFSDEWMREDLTQLSDWWDGDLTNEKQSFLWKVQALKEVGLELVPKGGFWRLSFSCAEEMILKKIDANGKKRRAALQLLKFVNQTRWTPEYGKILSSYHLKTLLLWSCEIYPHKEAWETLLSSLKTLLGLLKHTLAEKRLPHYFLKPLNLFNKHYKTSNDIYWPLSLETLTHEVSAMLADATAYLVPGHKRLRYLVNQDYEEKTAALREFKDRHREELKELKRMEDEHMYEEVETTEE